MKSEKKEFVIRTGVSFEPDLLEKFDRWVEKKGFPNRSEAIRYIIRDHLSKSEIEIKPQLDVIGTLTFIFNHHSFDSSSKLTRLQHDYDKLIISTMHAHVTHDLCLETVILKGKNYELQKFKDDILSFKGVLAGGIVITPIE